MKATIPDEFNAWWDSDWQADCPVPNIRKDSPLWWAYQGWMAGAKAEREACARVCEENADCCNRTSPLYTILSSNAAAIRARDEA